MSVSFEVRQRGVDSSGRPILATDLYWQVWQAVLDRPRVAPFAHLVTIVQGAFMTRVGGGASASAGYHDLGGCIDTRTWNLTSGQESVLLWEGALCGLIGWKRDAAHGGMDEHTHWIGGWDQPLASGADYQWRQALAGRDGLASNGPDYHPRPPGWPHFPPASTLEEHLMTDQQYNTVIAKLDLLREGLDTFRTNEVKRDQLAAKRAKESKQALVARLGGVADQLTALADTVPAERRKAVQQVKAAVLQALADDPDVDGPDNPDPTKLAQLTEEARA